VVFESLAEDLVEVVAFDDAEAFQAFQIFEASVVLALRPFVVLDVEADDEEVATFPVELIAAADTFHVADDVEVQ
jgi:hypothetical protein